MQIIKNTEKVSELFEGFNDSSLWSCLQGTMGEIYADSESSPLTAVACVGDFFFVAGKPDRDTIKQIRLVKPVGDVIIIPVGDGWEHVINKVYGNLVQKTSRYAIKKEPDVFDRAHLEKLVKGLPEGFELRPIDEELYNICKADKWSEDFVARYDTYDKFRDTALGEVILHDGRIVSGASSYSSYIGGIEVEIDTRKEYRRRSLAVVCGAALVLACLDRGLYPSWDAANLISVRIAEKLGYHLDREYAAFEVEE